MTAAAFTKFDPRAFLEDEARRGTAANLAKVAKAAEPDPRSSNTAFATLAALAGRQAEAENFELVPDAWTDAEEERAAMIEHEGGAPRAWAEALARLDPNKPPEHIPPHRWLRFIDDCGRFLDGGWADKAAALGWGPLDLFGCNPRRHHTFPRGLLWEVNGDRLIALHRDGAIIEIKRGDHRTYQREPVFGRVLLAWELAP